jgi:hypothetical protein
VRLPIMSEWSWSKMGAESRLAMVARWAAMVAGDAVKMAFDWVRFSGSCGWVEWGLWLP